MLKVVVIRSEGLSWLTTNGQALHEAEGIARLTLIKPGKPDWQAYLEPGSFGKMEI